MFVHTESRSLLLRVKRPEIITSILPKWRTVDYDGHNIAVPHRDDVVRVLRNLGIKAPPPILHYYDWPIQAGRVPFKHQLETAAFATLYPRCFILNDPGTAKTVPILWAADWLMRQKIIRKVLITAPLSTLNLVWADEIFGTLMHRRCAVLHGSKARRLELLSGDFDFYIVNHDGVSIIAPYLENRTDIDLVIVDECAEFRNASTDKYKALVSAIGKRRLWLMTGTPCPKSPEDAWAQARLINKQTVPEYASQWRDETMLRATTHKWIPKDGSYAACVRSAAACHPLQEEGLSGSAARAVGEARGGSDHEGADPGVHDHEEPDDHARGRRHDHCGQRGRSHRQAAPDPARRGEGAGV
jgi:hypothetical protein